LYAIGDMHGRKDAYSALLVAAGLTDTGGHWVGNRASVVQTGDLCDRGPASIECLEMTRRLQMEARAAGGDFEFLLGNHEVFVMSAASGNNWAFFNWSASQNGGSAFIMEWMTATGTPQPVNLKQQDNAYGELFTEFSTGGLGRWLRSMKTCTLKEDVLFVHAGVSRDVPAEADLLNAAAEESKAHLERYIVDYSDKVLGKRGPFWVRDLARDEVLRSLSANSAALLVSGHNPKPWITSMFDGRQIMIDTSVVRGGPELAIKIGRDGVSAFGTDGVPCHVELEGEKERPATRKYSPTFYRGRFLPGDAVIFYSSPVGGGMGVLLITEAFTLGGDSYYAGHQISYMPDRKAGVLRFNDNETWTYQGAFIDRVGVDAKIFARETPPEVRKALSYLI
jgi:hypothetical protein